MLTRGFRQSPTLVWAPVRFLPLVVNAAYLAVLHGPSRPTSGDWAFGMAAAVLTLAGGRWPLAVTVAQSILLVVGVRIFVAPVAQALLFVLAAVALGELWMRRGGWQCWVGVGVYVAALLVVYPPRYDPVLVASTIALATLPSVLLGRYIRSYLQVEVTAHRQRESAVQEARAAERTAIARELHDLIAHYMASIALRTGAARHALNDKTDPAVTEVLTQVHDTARTALADLRRLVATLRDPTTMTDEAGWALADPGGLSASLAAAVERARGEGLTLDVEIDPAIATMHSIQRLAVLRVAQEGLTNVIKHAGAHAQATLRVRATANGVHVVIRDDGGDRRSHDTRPDPGFGLVGMRERVELLGGSVRAGRRSSGWELAVVIPTGSSEEGR
ncbi:MAG TPA: sensor histidine kinase [Pseudonocardiaceae bacterium]|nr:sensor histidine kinase [Pseudonocardiaceae bacterium]